MAAKPSSIIPSDSLEIRDGPSDPESGLSASADTDKVSKLYSDYFTQLSQTLRRMYGNGPPDPEDVANEAFRKLIERGDISSIANLKGFVWRIARNIILKARRDHLARSKRDFEVENLYFPKKGDESTPERIIQAQEQLDAINSILKEMPEMRRRAFILHRIDGLTITETGHALGISRPGAAKHIARAAAEISVYFDAQERENLQ